MKDIHLNLWQVATIILLILFLWAWNCGGSGCNKGATTTVHYDTTWHRDTGRTVINYPAPVIVTPGQVPSQVPVIINVPQANGTVKHDTIYQKLDSLKIVQAYFATNHYEDSAKTQYGYIHVNTDVTQNGIKKQEIIPNLNVPEVVKTITQTAAKRGQLSVKFDLLANEKPTFLHGFGGGLEYRSRKDKQYSLKVFALNGQPYYDAGFGIPLTH